MKITTILRINARHARVRCKNRLYRVNIARACRSITHTSPTSPAQASRRLTAVGSVTSRKNHAIMRDPNLNTNISYISGPFINILTVLPVETKPLFTVRREIPHYRAKVAAMTPRATVEVSSSFHYISPSQHNLYTSLCI